MARRGTEKSIGFRLYKVPKNLQRVSPLEGNFINNGINIVEKSGAYINYREVWVIYHSIN